MVARFIHLVWKVMWNAVVVLVCASLIFIGYKANQPMSVTGAPAGMTYVEFIHDRLDAAKTIKPSQCGWGMILSLAALGPIYSVVYTDVAIHPTVSWIRLQRQILIFPKVWQEQSGMKSQESGGVWWSVYPGRCWGNKPHLDVSSDK